MIIGAGQRQAAGAGFDDGSGDRRSGERAVRDLTRVGGVEIPSADDVSRRDGAAARAFEEGVRAAGERAEIDRAAVAREHRRPARAEIEARADVAGAAVPTES